MRQFTLGINSVAVVTANNIYGLVSFRENCSTTISKQKENLLKEKERLVSEIETMRQRQKNMSAYAEELEKRNSEIDQRMNEMQETLGMQLNEISREKRIRERAEAETRQLEEEIAAKKSELEVKSIRGKDCINYT